MAGLDPAIRSGPSLRQMGDCVTGRDEWVAINARWYKAIAISRSLVKVAAVRSKLVKTIVVSSSCKHEVCVSKFGQSERR